MSEPEYSGETLGEIEICIRPGAILGGIVAMPTEANTRPLGTAPVRPVSPKHGDRIVLVFLHTDETVSS